MIIVVLLVWMGLPSLSDLAKRFRIKVMEFVSSISSGGDQAGGCQDFKML
jgi:hypothetical protein